MRFVLYCVTEQKLDVCVESTERCFGKQHKIAVQEAKNM